ncbi:recombinase family protein [Methylobacterium sp. 1973]|uniref:recombinase family protein n=1 Tax=Methylobacterium sp. 1973 TaxID=3156421 RepID=UPI0033990EBB
MCVRAYPRADIDERDPTRARDELAAFAAAHGRTVAAWYVENASSAKLEPSALSRLLADSQPGDVLLLAGVDQLSRLSEDDWVSLKSQIGARGLRIVSVDLPTSHRILEDIRPDDGTKRLFAAVNAMLIDAIEAGARKDDKDRRRRQAEGQARARAQGRSLGRPENVERNAIIAALLRKGMSWSQVRTATGCSRFTVAKVARAAQSRSVEA